MRFTLSAVTLLALLSLLELSVAAGWISPFAAARPSGVMASVPSLVADEALIARFTTTFAETVAAAALAVLVGIPIGWMFYASPLMDTAFRPFLAVLAAGPMILIYPLFLAFFGRSAATIIAIAFVAALAPTALKTRDGLLGTRHVLIEVGESFGLDKLKVFFRIMLPAAMPTIMTGVRISLVFALVNVVAVEFLINFGGLGQLVVEMADRYETEGVYAAILFIAVISAALYAATERLERWWRPA